MVIYFNENYVRFENSWKIPKSEFGEYIALLFERYPNFRGGSRSSLKWEWATHNFLYRLGYQRERTRSVDFESPQKRWTSFLFRITGVISWIFIP